MKDEDLEDLLLEESKAVFKYLIKIGASKENAEDIIQETLYKTLKNIDSIDGDKIRAWLFKVAINAYYNMFNSNKKHTNLSHEDIQSLELLTESIEGAYIKKVKKQDIHRALNMLKPSYKNLIVLKYFLNMSYKDIGDIMEISDEKVKVYLYRARNKFRKVWEEFNNE
jgi:RNA polymerase sigma-70 factor, ECF subfamily